MSASARPPAPLDGPGTDTLAVGNKDGLVVLQFQNPVKWVSLDPKTAYAVAEMMCRHAFATEVQDKVEGEWSAMIQKKRQNLLAKFEHALIAAAMNGKLSKTSELKYLAAQLLDHADDEYLGPRFSPSAGQGLVVAT